MDVSCRIKFHFTGTIRILVSFRMDFFYFCIEKLDIFRTGLPLWETKFIDIIVIPLAFSVNTGISYKCGTCFLFLCQVCFYLWM